MNEKMKQTYFTEELLNWYKTSERSMPWKGERNPYLIWLSEIILQQTRVAQGLPYYERFKAKYPTVIDLANAPEDELMKMWEGLGYYSRARNLHATAKIIATEYKGVFPKDYKTILSLKGVGPYTAAAIASFAYDLPYAVVDGNVYRVLSRFFGIGLAIDSTAGKKKFANLAQAVLDISEPGVYNQAIMDFGATCCTPKTPNCKNCNLKRSCVAFQKKEIEKYPFKSKKLKKRTRYFNFLILEDSKGRVLIHKRLEKDIWQQLYQFPLIETDAVIDETYLGKLDLVQSLCKADGNAVLIPSRPFSQVLSHQKIIATFWKIKVTKHSKVGKSVFKMVPSADLENYAFPRVIDLFLQDKTLYLDVR